MFCVCLGQFLALSSHTINSIFITTESLMNNNKSMPGSFTLASDLSTQVKGLSGFQDPNLQIFLWGPSSDTILPFFLLSSSLQIIWNLWYFFSWIFPNLRWWRGWQGFMQGIHDFLYIGFILFLREIQEDLSSWQEWRELLRSQTLKIFTQHTWWALYLLDHEDVQVENQESTQESLKWFHG